VFSLNAPADGCQLLITQRQFTPAP